MLQIVCASLKSGKVGEGQSLFVRSRLTAGKYKVVQSGKYKVNDIKIFSIYMHSWKTMLHVLSIHVKICRQAPETLMVIIECQKFYQRQKYKVVQFVTSSLVGNDIKTFSIYMHSWKTMLHVLSIHVKICRQAPETLMVIIECQKFYQRQKYKVVQFVTSSLVVNDIKTFSIYMHSWKTMLHVLSIHVKICRQAPETLMVIIECQKFYQRQKYKVVQFVTSSLVVNDIKIFSIYMHSWKTMLHVLSIHVKICRQAPETLMVIIECQKLYQRQKYKVVQFVTSSLVVNDIKTFSIYMHSWKTMLHVLSIHVKICRQAPETLMVIIECQKFYQRQKYKVVQFVTSSLVVNDIKTFSIYMHSWTTMLHVLSIHVKICRQALETLMVIIECQKFYQRQKF